MAPNPVTYTNCANCGRKLPVRILRKRRVCPPCKRATRARYQEEHRIPRLDDLDRGAHGAAAALTSTSACDRARADATIDKGGVFRYCGCGRKYQLTTFETPCPSCNDHLIDNPVEAA